MGNQYADMIRMEGMDLAIGDRSDRLTCPFCGGDGKTFTVSRVDDGLVYNCYRASCPAKGFIPSKGGLVRHAKKKQYRTQPYSKPTTLLPEGVTEWLSTEFSIEPDTIRAEGWRWNEDECRVVMPIRDQYHNVIGHNSRYWPELDSAGIGSGAKSITYWNDPECTKLHFPMRTSPSGNIVLLEDQPSAVRLSQDYNAMALLGTHMTLEMVEALASMKYDNAFIVLDADATAKAIKLRNMWGLYFLRMTIVPLVGPDVKDMGSLEYNALVERLKCG